MKKEIIAGLLSVGLLISVGCGTKVNNSVTTTAASVAQTRSVLEKSAALSLGMEFHRSSIEEAVGELFFVVINEESKSIVLKPKTADVIDLFARAQEGLTNASQVVNAFFETITEMSEVLHEGAPGWNIRVLDGVGGVIFMARNGAEVFNSTKR